MSKNKFTPKNTSDTTKILINKMVAKHKEINTQKNMNIVEKKVINKNKYDKYNVIGNTKNKKNLNITISK